MVETVDTKARSDIAKHEAVCAILHDQYVEHAKLNREEHQMMMDQLEKLGSLLTKYDRYALFRWVIFGGALLTILATAIVNHWFDAAYNGNRWL